MAELAHVLALCSIENAHCPDTLREAAALYDRVLSGGASEKVKHGARAARCLLYAEMDDDENVRALSRSLPHIWESREWIQMELETDEQLQLKAANHLL